MGAFRNVSLCGTKSQHRLLLRWLLCSILLMAAWLAPSRALSLDTATPSRAGTVGTSGAVVNHTDVAQMAPLYYLNWYSVNGGGETNINGTTFDLGISVGQAAAGSVAGAIFKLGVGYWYGAKGACPITKSGDINMNGTVTSADIIALVNYVFKGGAAPLPCPAAGDVNCSGTVTSADIIALVNYVFKAGAPPCDICTIIPSLWSCP